MEARFREGNDVEWMWLEVDSITADAVQGELGNVPGILQHLYRGDLSPNTEDSQGQSILRSAKTENRKSNHPGGASACRCACRFMLLS